jgi:tetratricopeptide (TPR) repeat protein
MISQLVIVFFASALAAEPLPEPPNSVCDQAHVLYLEGEYSQSISALNQCITDENLTSEQKACAILNRSANYFAMAQMDKAEGDAKSALRDDPGLQNPETASLCLKSSVEEAAELIELGADAG